MGGMRAPLLLRPSVPEPRDEHVRLPAAADNLFERLIRDPQAPKRPMRERQCAEMLWAVLVNCATRRLCLLRWMAQIARVLVPLMNRRHWSLETEQSIGSKRDDLRSEGWVTNDGDVQVGQWRKSTTREDDNLSGRP